MKRDSDKEVIQNQETLTNIGIFVLLAAECRDQDSLDALPGHLISNARVLDFYDINDVVAAINNQVDLYLLGHIPEYVPCKPVHKTNRTRCSPCTGSDAELEIVIWSLKDGKTAPPGLA